MNILRTLTPQCAAISEHNSPASGLETLSCATLSVITYQSGKLPFFLTLIVGIESLINYHYSLPQFDCMNTEFTSLLQRALVYRRLIDMHTRKMMDILSNTLHCFDLYSGREWTRNSSWKEKDKDRTKANPWPPSWQDEIIMLSTRKALQMNNKLSAFPPWSHLGILKYLASIRTRHQRMLIRKCDSWWII